MAKANNTVPTGNDFADNIANAERLSQTLLSVDLRFKQIETTLGVVTKSMKDVFDPGKIAKGSNQLDKFIRGLKEIDKLSEKMELVLRIKGMDHLDRTYERIKDVEKELKMMQSIVDKESIHYLDYQLKDVDLSKLPEAVQEAYQIIQQKFSTSPIKVKFQVSDDINQQIDAVYNHIAKVEQKTKELKKILDEKGLDFFEDMFKGVDLSQLDSVTQDAIKKLQDDFYDIDLDIPPLEVSVIPRVLEGNDLIEDKLDKVGESDKKVSSYSKFIKSSTGDEREKAKSGLKPDDLKLYMKAYQKVLTEQETAMKKQQTKEVKTGEGTDSYLKEKDKKEDEKNVVWKLMDKFKGGEARQGSKDFAKDVLAQVHLPQIPGMGQKSMNTAMSSPGAMAGVGIMAVIQVLEKIFQIISEASGFMKAIMKMINITIQMFFRPIGDMLGRFLMPYIRIMMVRTAQNYAKWAQGGFKASEFGGLMADNAGVMLEGLGAIIFDSLVKSNFMLLRGLVSLGAMIDKGLVWVATEVIKGLITQIIIIAQVLSTSLLGGLKYIVDAVFQIGKAIVNTGFEILRKIIGALFDVVQAAVYPIIAAFDKLINVVNGQGKDPEMRKDFVSGLNKVEAGVVGGINSVESGIVNAMNSVQVPLDNWFNNTIKSINTTADKWLKGLDTAISNLQKTLYDRLDKSAQEINTLLTNVEKAIPSALEWYEKQTASVFTNTMKSSGETVVQTKTTATATKTLVDKVGTGNQYAAEYNKQLAAANTALGGAGTIAKGLADNSKQITKTIGDAAGGAKLTGKDIVKSINSLKVTSQSDSTDTYTNSSTKTIAANGDMTLADAMSINRVGHTYAYFHSAEMAGLASGGYVKGPTKALIGEGSEPELVAPLSTGAKLIAGEITNILGNKQGDSRPIINVHVEVKGPVYGIDDFERKFDQLMKKEMTKWSWR